MKQVIVLTLLFLILGIKTSCVPEQNGKSSTSLTIKHIAKDFAIDRLDDPAWKSTSQSIVTKYWSGEAAPKGRQFTARLLWSDTGALCSIRMRPRANRLLSAKRRTLQKRYAACGIVTFARYLSHRMRPRETSTSNLRSPRMVSGSISVSKYCVPGTEDRLGLQVRDDIRGEDRTGQSRDGDQDPVCVPGKNTTEPAMSGSAICFAALAKIRLAVISPGSRPKQRNQTFTCLKSLANSGLLNSASQRLYLCHAVSQTASQGCESGKGKK